MTKTRLTVAVIFCLIWSGLCQAQDVTQSFSAKTVLPLPVWALAIATMLLLLAAAMVADYIRNLKIKLSDTESDLARSAAEWAYAMDYLEDPMYLVDLNDRLIRANRAFYTQIGQSPEQALGHDVRYLIHLKPEKTPCPACAARLERRDAFFTKEADDPTNPTGRPIEVTVRVVKDAQGNPIGIFQGLRDLSHLRQTEQALFEAKEKAQVTLRSIGDAVLTTDKNGVVEYANPATGFLLGQDTESLVGKNHDDVIRVFDSTTREPKTNPIHHCLNNRVSDATHEHCLIISHNNQEHVVDTTAAPLRGKNGELTGCVLVLHDVTEMHNITRKLNYQATHDVLTGLFNRREFEVRLSQALENTRVDNQQHTLIYMDMDNFKIVNDTCGHLAGDELLKQFCSLIRVHLRNNDTFARLGGDEFGVLLTGCPIQHAESIAADVQNKVHAFRFQWNDRRFEIGVSIGITLINADSGSAAEVLNNADSACYVAKNTGRNLIHIYNDNDVVVQQHRGEMQWVQRITQALADDRFTLFYQSIQPLAPGGENLHYFEILIRMLDEQGNLIGPQNFIPAAEHYQLMTAIDRWVINAAFTSLAEHNANSDQQWSFSINLSGQSLTDPDLLEYIITTQSKAHLNPQWICFEVTETAAITNLAQAKQFITNLKQTGFRFALDDFGSGMSSFAYLRELDIDFLKIDGAFVKQIDQNRIDYAMVSSINQIGQLMGIQTIAEFVENDQILELIKALQIDYAQGYGIDKPKPLTLTQNSKLKQHTG